MLIQANDYLFFYLGGRISIKGSRYGRKSKVFLKQQSKTLAICWCDVGQDLNLFLAPMYASVKSELKGDFL